MARKLVVEIIGDASSLEKSFKQAGHQTNTFGDSLKKVGKVAAFTAGGAALGGLFVALKRGADEFQDSQKKMAQTAAVLKSTGRAAHVTSKNVTDLATSLSKMSGIDDEVVQGAENMLLTFRNIRNGVGKNNKIFDKATATVLDMSTALGKDTKTSAIQLGKALNDPIKGVSTLKRVGVTFTDAQKKQIETLVKSGKTMEAQKVILKELQKEFGGSAKAAGDTFSGSLNKLKNSFDEVAGAVVQGLAPGLQKLADKVTNWLSKAENQRALQKKINEIMKTASDVITGVYNAIKKVIEVLDPVVQKFGGWKRVIEAIILLKLASKLYGIGDSFITMGGNAKTATGNVKNLVAMFKKLPKGVSIPLIVAASVAFAYPWVKKFFEQFLGADFSGLSKEPSVSIPNPKRKALHGTQGMSSAHTGTGPTVPGGPRTPGGRGSSVGMSFAPSVVTSGIISAAGAVFNAPVHVHGVQDPTQFLTWAQRTARKGSPSRSGPFAGHNLGLT